MNELLGFFSVLGLQFLLVIFYIAILLLLKHLIVSLFMRKPAKTAGGPVSPERNHP